MATQNPRRKRPSPAAKGCLTLQALRFGVIGDGQLARMLLMAGQQLGLQTSVLTENLSSPAAQVTHRHFKGSFKNAQDVQRFADSVDFLTFESEFVPPNILRGLEIHQQQQKTPTQIFPSPKCLIQFQNRKLQKSLLDRYQIPTSPWSPLTFPNHLDEAIALLGSKIVVKKNMGGYDGNGTFVLKTKKDIEKFQTSFLSTDSGFIVEKWQAFQRELAIMVGRTADGHFFHYPLVQTSQKNHRCDWVAGPLAHPRLKKWLKKIEILLHGENYVGILGIELFDLGQELLVNELAPRVHNSGHYTQEASNVSQFLAHILCGLGLKPQPILLSPGFVMMNLVGESEQPLEIPKSLSGSLHLYGKNENRPGRKMGHINYLGNNLKKLLEKGLKERVGIKK